jgi:hypothetical protein
LAEQGIASVLRVVCASVADDITVRPHRDFLTIELLTRWVSQSANLVDDYMKLFDEVSCRAPLHC